MAAKLASPDWYPAPAMGLEEIRRRAKRVGRDVEIARAVSQGVLRQELGLADFAAHRPARACGQDTTIDQFQNCIELLDEIFRPTAVVGDPWGY